MKEENIIEIRERARQHLGKYRTICDTYDIDYSWLSKFSSGTINNPTVRSLARLTSALDDYEDPLRDQPA